VQRILDAGTDAPAFVRNGHLDILAANGLGRALYSPVFADDGLKLLASWAATLDQSDQAETGPQRGRT
jgi:hypothetical protein